MRSKHEPPSDHFLQVIESRSMVFRIIYDTIIEVEGADEDHIYDILCRKIQKICSAKACALASCDRASRTLQLRSVYVDDEPMTEFKKDPIKYDAKFETIFTTTTIVENCESPRPTFIENLLQCLSGACENLKCSPFSCVTEGEPLAFGMVHLEPDRRLKMKDLIEAYLKMAGMIIQRVNALKTLREQAVQLEEWNRELKHRVKKQLVELEKIGRLKRFLSPQVTDMIISSGEEQLFESHRRNITVVFCDLRGFTPFSETAEPEDVMLVLREYHEAMGRLIFHYEGTLERFTGDGLMIFFNDPIPCPDPAARAAKMAVAMRDYVCELSEKWRRRGHQLDLGVGIAQGYATLGTIGFEGRYDYAAIGTVTNLASRLCDKAKSGQILISQKVYWLVEELVDVEPLGNLILKGLHSPISVYNLLRVKE